MPPMVFSNQGCNGLWCWPPLVRPIFSDDMFPAAERLYKCELPSHPWTFRLRSLDNNMRKFEAALILLPFTCIPGITQESAEPKQVLRAINEVDLWQQVKTTLLTYAPNFDESYGTRRVEEWLEEREANPPQREQA